MNKLLFSFVFMFFLTGCMNRPLQYTTIEKKQELDDYFKVNLSFADEKQFDLKKIEKTFGKPVEIIEKNDVSRLKFIVPDDGGNTLDYYFYLKDGKLKTIVYEDFIVITQFGLFEGYFRPWVSYECGEKDVECERDLILEKTTYSKSKVSRNEEFVEQEIVFDEATINPFTLSERRKKVDDLYQKNLNCEKTAQYNKGDYYCSIFSQKTEESSYADGSFAVCVSEKSNVFYSYVILREKNAQNVLLNTIRKDNRF